MTSHSFIAETDGTRLDQFLSDKLESLSRTRIKQHILNHRVTVNGEFAKPSYRIEKADAITITLPEETKIIETIEPENMPIDMIYEDDEIIVINKPPELVVHPGTGRRSGTLVHALMYHFKHLSDVNGPMRPGIVHRLDMETSGLMVVAKTNRAHSHIAKQFEQRRVKKTYAGITWGEWKNPSGTIEKSIGRKRSDPTMYTISTVGRSATTLYEVQQSLRYISLVYFFPKTGRTHQIRVHAASMGHPIFGDDKYSGGQSKVKGYIPEISQPLKKTLKDIGRHALHAHALEFAHPVTDKPCSFKAPFPNDMKTVLKTMESLLV